MAVETSVGEKSTINQMSFDTRQKQLEAEKKAENARIEAQREEYENGSKKSPYNRFIQLNEKKTNYLTELSMANPKSLAILLFIMENMDGYNALVLSYKVIQERFNISRTTASKCIKYLKEHGFLYVYKAGTCNVYVVNKELAWKSYGRNTKYCKFPANVMLSFSEQEQDMKNKLKKEKLNSVAYNTENAQNDE